MSKPENKSTIIRCPYCGMEYEASEIFMPGELTGKSKNVIKDPLGKVIYTEWCEDEEPNFVEHYECEGCGRSFIVEATVSYKVKPEDEERDFSNLESSLL